MSVYTVYDARSDPLANLRALLPEGLSVVGFLGTADDIDISLWRPFGARRVEHILLSDSVEDIHKRHIQYAVVGDMALPDQASLAAWLERTRAQVIATTTATMTVSQGPQRWYIVRLAE